MLRKKLLQSRRRMKLYRSDRSKTMKGYGIFRPYTETLTGKEYRKWLQRNGSPTREVDKDAKYKIDYIGLGIVFVSKIKPMEKMPWEKQKQTSRT